jgi:acetyltransferase-like isoleucine patch superfamily enzyme
VRIYTRGDDYSGQSLTNPTVPGKYLKIHAGSVQLGRHVIVGSGVVILPGVVIGEGAAVGALSLVKSSLSPWGIYGGVPARRLRDRSRELLDLEERLLAEDVSRSSDS